MDPISSIALMIKSLLDFATEAIKGQSPEQRQKAWDLVFAQIAWWQKLLPPPSIPPFTLPPTK